jgi:hypothetical protein
MAVKSKTSLGRVDHKEGKPKTTSIGHGRNSRPERKGKKRYRGQGR